MQKTTATAKRIQPLKRKTGPELGDLSAFKKIAEDTLALVEKDQMAEAKAKIKELESAWDDAEETMNPKNPSKWNSIDKSYR